jgi:hypothetical protein
MSGMIDALRRSIPLVAIVSLGALAGAGLVPLLSLGNDLPPEAEPVVSTLPPPSPSTVVEVEVETPVATIAGVSRYISRVLVDSGYLSRVEGREMAAQIDADVIRVLEESKAVITVFEEEPVP